MTLHESVEAPAEALDSLLRRVALGDRRAFADLFDHTYRVVESWLDATITGARREDVVIEVYLRIWSTAPSFIREPVDAWDWLADAARPLLMHHRTVDAGRLTDD